MPGWIYSRFNICSLKQYLWDLLFGSRNINTYKVDLMIPKHMIEAYNTYVILTMEGENETYLYICMLDQEWCYKKNSCSQWW